MRHRSIALALATLALACGAAIGQVLYGNLVGNVSDPQQGAVVGATVNLKSNSTGYAVETKTDDRGSYDIRNVPPGVYDIKIVAPGFSTFEAKDISIAANNIARVDAGLRVGNVSEVITVGAEVTQLQTDKTDLHTDIQAKELSQITIGGYRNYQGMIDLVPGANPSNFQNASTDTPARALTTNVNGASRNSNNNRIDGAASVMTWLPHHSLYVPPLESIETVNISTNNFDAEQGMAGGAAISVITKSGTNAFHGVAFLYHANHKWGAKNLFFNPNTPAGAGTPQRIDNQGGGTFGGPLKKDKLFFFTSWERTTTAERGNGLLSVPSSQVRSGNFAGLATIYDPTSGTSAVNGLGRTPFPNNQVPLSLLSPQAQTMQNLIPLPNTGAAQLSNFFASAPYYFKRDMADAKVNWTPSSNLNIFGKYSAMIAPVTGGAPLGAALGGYPGGAAGAAGIGTGHNNTYVFGGGISYVISPTMLFDGNFGGTHMNHDTQGPDYGTNIGLDVLKIPGTNGPDPRQSGFPIFDITGYTTLGNPNNWSPVLRNDRVYTYNANINWTKGAHNIRAGIDFIQHQMNHWQPELGSWSPRGRFNFRGGLTGLQGGAAVNNYNAYAAFLLGLPSEMGKAYQFYDPMRTREFQQGYFIRDNWQASRKVNINLGMRFEHFPIMTRGEYGIERYDPITNRVIIGGRGSNPMNAGTDAISLMYAPRVGLAYRMTEKTVFRIGYGITNDPYPVSRPLRSPFPAVLVDEYLPTNSFISPVGGGVSRTLANGIPSITFPDISSGNIAIPNTFSTNSLQPGTFRRGYIQSYNLTIQREIGKGFVMQTGYVGTRSIRAAVTYFDANAGIVEGGAALGRPLFPTFGVNTSRNFFIPMGYQRYDGWQTNFTKRYSSGLFATVSHTWSKTISTVPGNLNNASGLGTSGGNSDTGLAFYVPSAFNRNRGLAAFDRAHVFQTAFTYELPFGKSKKMATSGAGSMLLGGWQINGNLSAVTGNPFTVLSDGASLQAPGNVQVADQKAPSSKLGGVGLGTPYYDPASFAAVTEPRFGNMGIYNLRGPGFFNMNAGLFRSFTITERFNIQFRAEGLNVTNTPQLQNPNLTVTTPSNFMAITAANQTQRTLRFGLRLAF